MTLPTPLPTLRRPSNAYSNRPTNAVPTTANPHSNRVLPTPLTPLRLEAPLWALGPALLRPLKEEGKRRAERPRQTLHTDNARNAEASGTDRRQCVASRLECAALPGEMVPITVIRLSNERSNLLPGASHCDNRVIHPLELLCFPSLARCLIVTGTHGKGFSRVACHIPGSSLVGTARSRSKGCWRNLKMARYSMPKPERTRRGWWVGSKTSAVAIIDLISIFRGPVPKTCCPLVTVAAAPRKNPTFRFWARLGSKNPERSA